MTGEEATLPADHPLGERKRLRRSLRQDALNLPNLLTFGRVFAIPIVILLLDRGTPETACWRRWCTRARRSPICSTATWRAR
jgi:hypothetical protein